MDNLYRTLLNKYMLDGTRYFEMWVTNVYQILRKYQFSENVVSFWITHF